jgi:ParB family transcriptional regulator, chromosome partitioning protein
MSETISKFTKVVNRKIKTHATILNTKKENEIQEVPLSQIKADSEQPRKEFNDEKLDFLADSIEEQGLVQPIVLRREGNYYVIIAGERRYRAFKKLNKVNVPAIIRGKKDTQETISKLQLIENLQRSNLNSLEIAESIYKLTMQNAKQSEIARITGYSKGSISDYCKVYKNVQNDEKERNKLKEFGIKKYREEVMSKDKSSTVELFNKKRTYKSFSLNLHNNSTKDDIKRAIVRTEEYIQYLKNLQ